MRNGLLGTLMIACVTVPVAAEPMRSDGEIQVHTGPGSRLAAERRVHVRTSAAPEHSGLQVVRGGSLVSVAARAVEGCVPGLDDAPRLLDVAFRPAER